MELKEALKELPYKKQFYFKWKNDYGMRNSKTDEEALKQLAVKDFYVFEQWESSSEYQYLMNMLIQSRIGRDLQEIYESTTEKAKSGDEKAIKILFEIQKQIAAMNKEISSKKPSKKKSESVYDDLEL